MNFFYHVCRNKFKIIVYVCIYVLLLFRWHLFYFDRIDLYRIILFNRFIIFALIVIKRNKQSERINQRKNELNKLLMYLFVNGYIHTHTHILLIIKMNVPNLYWDNYLFILKFIYIGIIFTLHSQVHACKCKCCRKHFHLPQQEFGCAHRNDHWCNSTS